MDGSIRVLSSCYADGAVHVLSSCYLDGGCSWSHELRLYLLEFLSFCVDEFYLLEINHGHC